MQTGAASIEENVSGGSYAYRASKTAQNQCMKSLAVDLEHKGKIFKKYIHTPNIIFLEAISLLRVVW